MRLLLALLVALLLPATAQAQVPTGADWSQEYVATPDGESLHVDVLRPKGLPAGERTPVIAVISPYLTHGGPGATPQPNGRFNEFFEGAKVFERGWTVVLADLRGTGGSSGCLDILGPGEQTDIKTIVEWAAGRPWSTGKVAMYGKSYDGNTGVVAAALRPKGLAAVVAQQVVGDRYRGSYSGGVRYVQSFAYPFASYGTQAEAGWTLQDDPQYTTNSVAHSADCQAALAMHYNPDPAIEFWRVRDFVAMAKGSQVPFLMTHGFLDTNTNIGAGAIDLFNVLEGPKRLWLGWWDHVRGDDMAGDRLAMGRAGWYDEVMRFLDRHVRGEDPAVEDPAVALQDSDGQWRAEEAWPPADAEMLTAPLKPGSYADDGRNLGSNDSAAGAGGQTTADHVTGSGAWTISPPLPHPAHLAGIPQATVDVTPTVPDTNLVVNVYDIAPDGRATMISRGARLVSGAGPAELPLYPSEWTFHPGHRIGVLVSGANAEAWVHAPTNTTVLVGGGSVRLPFLRHRRTPDLTGTSAPRLESYRERAPFDVPADVLAAPAEPALVPPAQIARAAAPRLTARLRRRGRLVTISGRAPHGARVRVVLRRGGRVIARRTAIARRGRYRVRVRARGRGRLVARASTRVAGTTLRARS